MNLSFRVSALLLFGIAWILLMLPCCQCFNKETPENLKTCEEEERCLEVNELFPCATSDIRHTCMFIVVVLIVMTYPVPYLLADNKFACTSPEVYTKIIRSVLLAVVFILNIVVIFGLSECLKLREREKSSAKGCYANWKKIRKNF